MCLTYQYVLHVTLEAIVPVDAVILNVGQNQVFNAYRTTEELNTVIRIRVNLDVVNSGTRTYTTKRDTVQLVVQRDFKTAELYANVAQDTRVVFRVSAPEYCTFFYTFNLKGTS